MHKKKFFSIYGGVLVRRSIKEWISVQLVKNPGRVVLIAILLFNVVFFLTSAIIISALSLEGTERMGFIEAAFCTITMILDAGCIQFVVADIGQSGVLITVACLCIIFVGMISFTGAVIGYITNYISDFIEHSNTGKRKLHLSEHFVILNWNTRASEIVNDMLYSSGKQKVVVLVGDRKDEVQKEIDERISDTIARENALVLKQYAHLKGLKKWIAIHKNKMRNRLTVIVREGDIFSSKQLNDISLERARSIIILGNDINNTLCRFEQKERIEESGRGNSQTIKTLMQVADITGDAGSRDDQRIIVEITDEWTKQLVDKVIQAKEVGGKCNIIPVKINEVLGQILSQFCLMPELNAVYSELFSNKGAEFYSVEEPFKEDVDFIDDYIYNHGHAIPVRMMKKGDKSFAFYVADEDDDISVKSDVEPNDYSVTLNDNYWIERKNVIILGHNSKCKEIMEGFRSFSNEWRRDEEIVRIVVIDDKKSLEKLNYYREYPFVIETVVADIYDKDIICDAIDKFMSFSSEDVSVLILSDDDALNEDIDANALANLIYVRDIVEQKKATVEDFDPESIDIIVEIIDPKHHDIVNSYSVNNVVISNRYISKMVTQISEVESLFDFYNDILSYDNDECQGKYTSKEIYIKKVRRLFTEIPGKTTADVLVRTLYKQTRDTNPTICLGYVKPGGIVVVFGGELSGIPVELDEHDKLIVFSSH